jgi:ribose transport system permease protein
VTPETRRKAVLRSIRASAGGTSYAWPALVAVVILSVATAIAEPAFFNRSNWPEDCIAFAPFVLIAMAQAAPIASGNGGLDLSVGPLSGFITVIVATVLVPRGIQSPEAVIPIVIALGLAVGAVNGWLVAYGRLPAVIVTLAGYLAISGLSLQIEPSPGGSVPSWLTDISGSYGPVPGALVLIAAVCVVWIGLQASAFRRNLVLVGGDDRLAFTAGVNVGAIRVGAYMVAGAVAAVAGLALAASLGSGDPTVGPYYSLVSFAGVALGGVSLIGGRGGMLGAAAGGAILFLIQNLLTVAQVSTFHQQIAEGAILLLALTVNSVALKMRHRRYGPLAASGGAFAWIPGASLLTRK